MNIHKEKCKRLKAIRKRLADGLGIDLKQRECTFEGECRGTCPKCRQEEEALNRALLGKAAAVAVSAGILLTGCQGETENIGNPSGRSKVDWEEIAGDIAVEPEYDESVPARKSEEYWEEIEGCIAVEPEYDESVPACENEE